MGSLSEFKDVTDALANMAQVGAITAAAGYFAYRALAGYFLNNLTVVLECTRQRRSDTTDVICVKLCLKKHDVNSARLLKVRWRADESKPERKLAQETRAYGDRTSSVPPRALIDDVFPGFARIDDTSWLPVGQRPLNLAPHEEMQSAALLEVSHDMDVRIEAVVTGKQAFPLFETLSNPRPTAQWRASTIVLARAQEPVGTSWSSV